MEVMDSPYKHATDSPSKQILYELEQLRITAQEEFYAQLDRENHEREVVHRAILAAAAAEHDRVRQNAEVEREKLELQIEAERKRREDEARKELDRKRQEKSQREIEERKREAERARTAELEEQRADQARKAEADAAEKKGRDKERQDAEAARRLAEKQEVEAKAKEATIAAQKAHQTQQAEAQKPSAKPTPVKASPLAVQTTSRNPGRESEHQRYREIHHRLKDLRKFMAASAKQNTTLKKRMGDMRREIKKCVGQLTEGKGANRTPVSS